MTIIPNLYCYISKFLQFLLQDNTLGIYPGIRSADPTDLAVAGNFLFFAATNPYRGRELFFVRKTDGQIGFIDIVPGAEGSYPAEMSGADGQLPLLFQAKDPYLGVELWVTTDGQQAEILFDICVGTGGSNPRYITFFRGKFYFQADDCIHGNLTREAPLYCCIFRLLGQLHYSLFINQK